MEAQDKDNTATLDANNPSNDQTVIQLPKHMLSSSPPSAMDRAIVPIQKWTKGMTTQAPLSIKRTHVPSPIDITLNQALSMRWQCKLTLGFNS